MSGVNCLDNTTATKYFEHVDYTNGILVYNVFEAETQFKRCGGKVR